VALLELRRCAADLATTAADRDANASELLKCRQQIEEPARSCAP